MKTSLVNKITSTKNKRMLFWLIVFLLIGILWIVKKDLALTGTIGLIILAFFLSHASDYDSWLEEIK